MAKAMMENSAAVAWTLSRWDNIKNTDINSCPPCFELAVRKHEEGRKEVWDALPTYFGLPAWTDLNDFEG